MRPVRLVRMVILFLLALSSVPAYAQQTGAIIGKVVDSGGGVLPGVTVEASSERPAHAPRPLSRGAMVTIVCRRCRPVTTP